MVLVTDYTIEPIAGSEFFKIVSRQPPLCPVCGCLLSGYDTRARHIIDGTGTARWYKLRRLRCPCCRTLHIEAPDFMLARKHYDADTIARVRAGHAEDCPAEDSTIRRWLK